jgi:pimeloyl-ACP methyl ester carboxylesterase
MSVRRAAIRTEFARIAGIRTRVLQVDGAGPTLVLLHGFTDSADTWSGVLTLLAESGRAGVAIDLPGHGRAEELPRPWSPATFDDVAREAVEQADSGSGTIVVGNSLGALLALRCAADPVPGMLGVVAIAPPGDVINAGLRALPRLAPVLDLLLRAPVPATVLGELAGRLYLRQCVAEPISAQTLRSYTQHLGRRRLRHQIALGKEVLPTLMATDPGSLRDFVLPVTIWLGRRDRICPARGATRFNGSAHIVIDEIAHCPQLTSPELVISRIEEHENRTCTPSTRAY